jgi:putative ATPase
LINIIEQIALAKLDTLDMDSVGQLLQEKIPVFDKGGDIFYQQLSAFHKSVRGSSPDGALYWMARMLVAGCDAKTIARRLLAIASEDIGNADPRALEITLNAWQVFERVGEKEGNRAIAQAAVYCAVAPKSNAVYKAFNQAMSVAKETGDLPVPKHLCNAPTGLMNDLGYGEGYRYAHNEQDAVAKGQTYFPEALGEQSYYAPTQRGLEIKISEKLKQLRGK